MSKSVTKARIVLIQVERNRMIPRFPLMRSGGPEVLCHRSGHHRADSLDALRHRTARTDGAPSATCVPVRGQCASIWSINAICRIEMAPTAGLEGRHVGDQNGADCRVNGVGRPVLSAQQRVARRWGRAVVT